MTIAATLSLLPPLSPSKFVFHSIVVETSDFVLWKNDYTEVACTLSAGAHQDDEDHDMDVLTPYPAHATTSEEIQEWMELEQSLGENWSLRLAGELSPSEMSLNSTESDDDEDGEMFDSSYVFDDDESSSESSDSCFQPEENEETKRNRNLLWKQSLKLSLFTST